MSWHKLLFAGLTTRNTELNLRLVKVRFVVDKVEVRQIFLQVFWL
jgi:hypothetical protein